MSPAAGAPERDTRAAVDKAISLLTAFGDDAHSGLGVSELARRSGMSKSTAFRLLGLLTRNGVVDKTGKTYRLGHQLQLLSASTETRRHGLIREGVTPFLAELYEATHETTHLAVLQGSDVVYLGKIFGHRSAAAPSRVGGRAPAHCTGVGKTLLAYDPGAREALMTGTLRALTTRTITDPADLAIELDQVLRRGIAHDTDEAVAGLSCVAAPIIVRGTVVAALSVSGSSDSFATAALELVLRRVCAAAGRHLTATRRLSPSRSTVGQRPADGLLRVG